MRWLDSIGRLRCLVRAVRVSFGRLFVFCFSHHPPTTNQTIKRHHTKGIAEQVERILKRNPKFSLTRSPSLHPITRIAMLDRGVFFLGACVCRP